MNTVIIEFTAEGANLLRVLGRRAREAGLWTDWVRFTATRTSRRSGAFRYEVETDADPLPGGKVTLTADSAGTPLVTASWSPHPSIGWETVNRGSADWVKEPLEDPGALRHVAVFPTSVLTGLFTLIAGSAQTERVAA